MSNKSQKNSPMAELYLELRNDVATLIYDKRFVCWKEPKKQSHKRHILRSIASFIEAMTYQLREVTLNSSAVLGEEVPSELKFALQGRQIDIDSNGRAQIKKLRTNSLALIKFSMRTFDEIFHTKYCPAFDSKQFKCVIGTFEVRDRLMHPKNIKDIAVTDSELSAAINAFHLVENMFGNIVLKSNEFLSAKLRAILDEGDSFNKNKD